MEHALKSPTKPCTRHDERGKGGRCHMWCLFWFGDVERNGGKRRRGRRTEGGPVSVKSRKVSCLLGETKRGVTHPHPPLFHCASSSKIQLSLTSSTAALPLR